MPGEIPQVWDPFVGTRDAEVQRIAPPTGGLNIPAWIGQAFLLLALAAVVGIVISIFWRDAAWVAVPALVVSIAGVISVDYLGKAKGKRDWRFFRIAEENGWSFRLIAPESRRKVNGRTVITLDPLARQAYERIGALCRPRTGQLIPLKFQAMYWGRTPDEIPFWLGLQEYEVDASMAVEALKKDGFNNRSARGKLYNMVVSYRLDRDTGITASLLAEALDRDGWRDVKTESAEFNARFKIAVEPAPGSRTDAQMALLRALTPATQATLIALDDRYRLQMMIDGDTIHLSGTDRIMSEDEAVIAAHVNELVNGFAAAAVSFKRFVE